MTVFALDLTILCDRSTWQISWYSWSVCSLLVLWYLEVIYKFVVSTDNFLISHWHYKINALALIFFIHFCVLFHLLSTVASGLNALAAVTVEDFAPLVVRHIPTERETLVSKLLGM